MWHSRYFFIKFNEDCKILSPAFSSRFRLLPSPLTSSYGKFQSVFMLSNISTTRLSKMKHQDLYRKKERRLCQFLSSELSPPKRRRRSWTCSRSAAARPCLCRGPWPGACSSRGDDSSSPPLAAPPPWPRSSLTLLARRLRGAGARRRALHPRLIFVEELVRHADIS